MTSGLIENPKAFEEHRLRDHPFVFRKYLGRGKIGVVYRAEDLDINDTVACKVIPPSNLKTGWENELKKVVKLHGIPQVVQFRQYCADTIEGTPYVIIISEYVDGTDLKEFAKAHPTEITIPFIENLTREVLLAFHAMMTETITHGDLHEGNILVAKDPRFPDGQPRIKITDFGIGSTSAGWQPRDDYSQLALICRNLIESYVDPAKLNPEDRSFYDAFVNDFLPKKLLETDPTVADFVRVPQKLIQELDKIRTDARGIYAPPPRLVHPFDYLSCEQIGNSFELLQLLYSQNFPGYSDLTERTNTILTGPRGCGKTTIFRNLSLKTRALAGKLDPRKLGNFVGVYYQCSDLYYAFPHLNGNPTEDDQRAVTHYFNLAILYEILDTFSAVENIKPLKLDNQSLLVLEGFLRGFLPKYESAPAGTDIIRHLKSVISGERERVKNWLDSDRSLERPELFLPIDFLKRISGLLQEKIPWIKGRPFYFFLDDYSLPRISPAVQISLNNFILDRYSELFFKISTESATTVHTVDAHGKLLEETREYDMIDLGGYFLHAPAEIKNNFLQEVVNQRLKHATEKPVAADDIAMILGGQPFESYNELARAIRNPKKRVLYHGWKLVVDLCSGDIAIILRLIRDMFSFPAQALGKENLKVVSPEIQDRAMRENANDFLNRIESAPETGKRLRKIAVAFGKVANWYLLNRNSKNVKTNPPWQAFRIEVRETPELPEATKPIYNDLIKYGVFLRDVRGKSQRGAVIPRLYLRRLLIPTFRLTPSQRDNIGLNPDEFVMLLEKPEDFVAHMQGKPRRSRDDTKQTKLQP